MNGNEPSLIHAVRGPITLITVGVLFALNNFTPYGFQQTWPVLLIVIGVLSLMQRGSARPRAPQGGMPMPPSPAPGPSTSYRQSSYQGQNPGGGQ